MGEKTNGAATQGKEREMKDTISLKLKISGIVLIACSVIPFLIIPMMAFPTEYLLERVVYFSMVLDWRSYPFSIQTMVGWCYLFSMIFSVAFLAVGVMIIKKARLLFGKKIPVIAIGTVLGAFLLFSAIINIIQIAQEGMKPTFMFVFYILTQILAVVAIAFALITTQIKKQNYKQKNYKQRR